MQRMADSGLVPWALNPTFADARTGQLLQVDGVFVRI
jgi:hypothetical protein